MITENDLTFGDAVPNGSGRWIKEVIFKGECIGVMGLLEASILRPVKEDYSCGCEYSSYVDDFNYIEAEDDGWVYVFFDTVSEMLEFINNKPGNS